jgi:hypothetical protein
MTRGPAGAGGELERGELGASSGAARERRVYHCNTHLDVRMAAGIAMPEHPRDDGSPRPKWISKWEFEREGKRTRIVVVAHGPSGKETIDAREFIERLGEDHRLTTFAIHVETEQIGT